jgi:hypothetical protein
MQDPNYIRPDLPTPLPSGVARLPRRRGYPVPWFVGWIGGEPEFRMADSEKLALAVRRSLCWVCGDPIVGLRAYLVGPMCAVNRTSAEPPSHVRCADWSARACPFLTRPHARRREAGMPEEREDPAGIMLKRNPGVSLLWVTGTTTIRRLPNDILFDLGRPNRVAWYAEGRTATREEILASIDSGLPALRELAEEEGNGAPQALDAEIERALRLLPV